MLIAGLTPVVVGLLLLTRVTANGGYYTLVLPALVLMGIGGGVAIPALMGLAMSDAGPEDAGVASGLINTTQQAGAAIGTAVLATVAASRTGGLLAKGDDVREALTAGFRLAYGVSSAFLLAAIVVGAAVLSAGKAAEPELALAQAK